MVSIHLAPKQKAPTQPYGPRRATKPRTIRLTTSPPCRESGGYVCLFCFHHGVISFWMCLKFEDRVFRQENTKP